MRVAAPLTCVGLMLLHVHVAFFMLFGLPIDFAHEVECCPGSLLSIRTTQMCQTNVVGMLFFAGQTCWMNCCVLVPKSLISVGMFPFASWDIRCFLFWPLWSLLSILSPCSVDLLYPVWLICKNINIHTLYCTSDRYLLPLLLCDRKSASHNAMAVIFCVFLPKWLFYSHCLTQEHRRSQEVRFQRGNPQTSPSFYRVLWEGGGDVMSLAPFTQPVEGGTVAPRRSV